ncbi:MAG: HIT family protein [Solirubrobacteraceae bacterium]
MSDDCIFCAIAAGEAPATTVAEDERTVAFMDISPATDGHLLVIPRAHYEDVLVIDDGDLDATMHTARAMARRVKDRLGADGVNLLNSCGRAAWQTVFHFHVHVIPRYAGDPLRLPWVPGPGDRDEIAAAARKITG